jgi:hypothetical protein
MAVRCEFWDGASNPHPAMYLQIEGDNALGFAVFLNDRARLRWRSLDRTYVRGSRSLDFREQYTGWDGGTRKSGGRAANFGSYWTAGGAAIGAVRFTYETLEQMGFRTFTSEWWLGAVIGGPHTEWSRVLFLHRLTSPPPPGGSTPDDGTFRINLQAIPHEYGHVIFNNLHSNGDHYWKDVFGYAKVHYECVPIFANFAYYEGFGDTISDLVWGFHDKRNKQGRGAGDRCSTTSPIPDEGSLLEANVADFYYSLVYGHDESAVGRAQAGNDYYFYSSPTGTDDYWLFPATLPSSMVAASGNTVHNLPEVWRSYLRQQCALTRTDATGKAFPSVCSTQAFKCAMQQKSILSPYDQESLGLVCNTLPLLGAVGSPCGAKNSSCRSGRCDSGPGTQNTSQCIPNDGEGRMGEFCNSPNQCRSQNCRMAVGATAGVCAPRPGVGDDCRGQPCADGRNCDGNNRCVPRMGEGRFDDYCSNQNQCASQLDCFMPVGQNFGACASRPDVGEDCRGRICADGRNCDGNNRCVPRMGEGRRGDYCSNQNQCSSSLNCVMATGQNHGVCRSRPGIGDDCGHGQVCAAGRNCDANARCIPNRNEGAPGQYCSNDVQCLAGHRCVLRPNSNWGYCN